MTNRSRQHRRPNEIGAGVSLFGEKDVARRAVALLESLSPLSRMVNSQGIDEAFERLAREFSDLSVHEYPPGQEFETWIIPMRWAMRSGSMVDPEGRVIADTSESPLFVAPYSQSVDGWFTRQEIAAHLTTRPDRPNAFALEHRYAYNYQLKTWGITLPHGRWESLPEGRYHIKIETVLSNAPLRAAEITLPGERPEIIGINAHIDELCNDDLSGCVVGIELFRWLKSLKKRTYSYQLLLTPELIGTLAYIHTNPEIVRRMLVSVNVETVGAGAEWCLKRALQPGIRLERAMRQAFHDEGLPFREIGFFEGYGNDERVFSWPSIGIPSVAIQRFPFPEYHTSDDIPAIVSPTYLYQAFNVLRKTIEIIEADFVPRYHNSLPPWLSRFDLYYDATNDPAKNRKFNHDVLFSVDGYRSVQDIADTAGLAFGEVLTYLDRFVKEGLMTSASVQWGKGR